MSENQKYAYIPIVEEGPYPHRTGTARIPLPDGGVERLAGLVCGTGGAGPAGPQGEKGDKGDTGPPGADGAGATTATTTAAGIVRVDHNGAGNPVALTAAGHALDADPHPQYVLSTEVGQAGGVAALDGSGKVPAGQLPSSNGLTIADVIDTLYPVGSLYTSTLSTNPGTLLGRGTWAAFGAGRVMVGYNAGDTDFNASEKTGGTKTVASAGTVAQPTFTGTQASLTHSGTAVADHASHTHSVTSNVAVGDHASHTHSVTSNVAVADHASHTHTYTDVPNHTHPHNIQGSTTAATTGTNVMASTATGGSARAMAIATSNPSGGVATGTTAGPSATLTHAVTNNAVTSGGPSATLSHSVTNNAVTSAGPSATLSHSVTQPTAHDYTPAGSVSQPAFTGSASSVVQPYITVFCWKRTA